MVDNKFVGHESGCDIQSTDIVMCSAADPRNAGSKYLVTIQTACAASQDNEQMDNRSSRFMHACASVEWLKGESGICPHGNVFASSEDKPIHYASERAFAWAEVRKIVW